jgi:hypothetical protein
MSSMDEARQRTAIANNKPHKSENASRPEPSREPFEFIDSAEFLTTDHQQTFLIPHILVKDQPGVIAGPSKAMKTSIAVDMAVSLASASPFLGEFHVPIACNVAVVSGESGRATLKETALRVIAAKGLEPEVVFSRLQWCFELPQFLDVEGVQQFAQRLTKLKSEIVFIDPTYLSIGVEIDHANLFKMGAAYRGFADILLKAGVTPILLHHANRLLKLGERMELTHLAYAGLEQFARQWLFINRRTTYRGDGNHDLLMSAGGSAGHGGQWGVEIEEGTVDAEFRGRVWNVNVMTEAEAVVAGIDRKNADRQERERNKPLKDESSLLSAIDNATASNRPCTKAYVREQCSRLKGELLTSTADRLIQSGMIEPYEVVVTGGHNNKQRATAYRRRNEQQ